MRGVLLVLVGCALLGACQVQQSWVWKDTALTRQATSGVRVGIAPPAFSAQTSSAWEAVLSEVLQAHPGIVLQEKNADYYLWVSVDSENWGSLLNLSLRDARGRILAVMTRESSDFTERRGGRALPEGSLAMMQALREMVRAIFPDPRGRDTQQRGPAR